MKLHFNTRHGLANTKVQKAWSNMKYRCLTPTCSLYKYYGAKGISVCKRWMVFENFLSDMGMPPTKMHTLDRINGSKGYSKANCRWATYKQQSDNLKNNKKYIFKGESFNEREWSRKLGLHRSTIRSRIRMGWPIEKVLSYPVQKREGI